MMGFGIVWLHGAVIHGAAISLAREFRVDVRPRVRGGTAPAQRFDFVLILLSRRPEVVRFCVITRVRFLKQFCNKIRYLT